MDTLRILRVDIMRCKVDNERLVRAQEKQAKVNAVILQSLAYLQTQRQYGIGASNKDIQSPLEPKERKKGAGGSKYRKKSKKESEDTMRGNAPLSTPKRITSTYGHHSSKHSSSTNWIYHHHSHYHH